MTAENEPDLAPAPANDDARPHLLAAAPAPGTAPENEPGPDRWDALPAPVRVELDEPGFSDERTQSLARSHAT